MNVNSGYKAIAIVSLSYALFSCADSVESHSDPVVLAELNALQQQIETLSARLGEVYTAVSAEPDGTRACSIQEVIDQTFADCDPSRVPDGVSTATTYCIQQNRAGALGAVFKVEPEGVGELGAGWPNAIWGKITGRVKFPAAITLGPVPVPIPNELTAGGQMSLGRGLSLCVDIPVDALDADQVAQVHDLVRGVNDGGKYSRRMGRVLDYAARRTPIASAGAVYVDGTSKPYFTDDDDSFDVADAAIERLIDGDFQIGQEGARLFGDPVFQDLVTSLDAPAPLADTVADPERVFGILKTIGQANIASTCQEMGISAESQARFPALANQCARFGIYPNINAALDAAEFVGNIRTRVNAMYTASALKNFMCSNIALAAFAPEC